MFAHNICYIIYDKKRYDMNILKYLYSRLEQ